MLPVKLFPETLFLSPMSPFMGMEEATIAFCLQQAGCLVASKAKKESL